MVMKKSGLASPFYLKSDKLLIDNRATMLQMLKFPSMKAYRTSAKLQPLTSIAPKRKSVISNMYMIRLGRRENNIGMTLQCKRKAIIDLRVHVDLWSATMPE